VCLLDALGKLFLAALWQRATPSAHRLSFGFLKGRRREEATAIMRATIDSLNARNIRWAAVLLDIANAFPSLVWDTADRGLERCARTRDTKLLCQRQHCTTLLVQGGDDQVCWSAPRCGTMQGDGPAAQIFGEVYDEGHEKVVSDFQSLRDE
jgi:hypothetical protein